MNKYFTVSVKHGVTVVKMLVSEIPLGESEDFKNMLFKTAEGGKHGIIINMESCVFVPSLAIGILISFRERALAVGCKVVMCSLTKEVKTIFDITKLHTLFEVFDTEESALASFKRA